MHIHTHTCIYIYHSTCMDWGQLRLQLSGSERYLSIYLYICIYKHIYIYLYLHIHTYSYISPHLYQYGLPIASTPALQVAALSLQPTRAPAGRWTGRVSQRAARRDCAAVPAWLKKGNNWGCVYVCYKHIYMGSIYLCISLYIYIYIYIYIHIYTI